MTVGQTISYNPATVQSENIDPNPSRQFRLCQRCGMPTPAQVPECVNCGARSLQAVVASDLARAEQRFAQAYFSRATPLTYGILGLNILIYLFMTYVAGGNFFENLVSGVDSATLVAFGAKTNALLSERGEWFRLVTPIFIHGGLIHILSNSYALWMVGPQVERLYGSARFIIIYLLSGVMGVIGSYLNSMLMDRDPMTPSVGASGAIFGLFGVLAVFGYKYRKDLPPAFRHAFGAGVFPVIAINLFIGFSVPVIDNGAHIGGLVGGALLALLIPYIAPGEERVSRVGLIAFAICLAVVGYSFFRAWRTSAPHLVQRIAVLNRYLDSLNATDRVMGESAQTRNAQEIRALKSQLEETADKLDAARGPDQQSDELRRELSRILRARAAALDETSLVVRDAKLAATSEDFERVGRKWQEWMTTAGKQFGIVQSKTNGR
jgi:membrane associated rhomboid family serine protease